MRTIWKHFCARVQQRWVFAVMGFLSGVNANAMKSCLSLAITEMVAVTSASNYSDDSCAFLTNSTTVSTTPKNIAAGVYDWDEKMQGMILSSFFWGYILTQLPSGVLAEKFGGKYVMGFGILTTAIFTLLVPFAVDAGGSTALMVLRFLMGLGDGMNLPSSAAMLSRWAPPSERSKMGTLVFSGSAIGTLIGSGISGLLMYYSPLGWRLVFYVYGSSGIIWFLAWVVLCYDNPDEHPFISDGERKFLHEAMHEHVHTNIPSTPWRHIVRSVPFWALVVSVFGQDWGCFTLLLGLPKYLSSVLKLSVRTNGLLTGVLLFAMWIISLGYSWVADRMINRGTMSITNVRKFFSTLSTLGTGAFLIVASYMGCNRVMAVACLTMAMLFVATMFPGMRVNSLDLSPNYSATLLAFASSITAVTGILSPAVVSVLAPHQTAYEWGLVFWVMFVIYCVTNLVYAIWASGEVQRWNNPEYLINEGEKRKNKAAGAGQPE